MTYSRSLLLGLTLLLAGAPVQPAAKKLNQKNFQILRGGARLGSLVAAKLRTKLPTHEVTQRFIDGDAELQGLMPFADNVLETAQQLCDTISSSRSVEQLKDRFTLVTLGAKLLVKSAAYDSLWEEYPSILAVLRLAIEPTEKAVHDLAKVDLLSEECAGELWNIYATAGDTLRARDAHDVAAKMLSTADQYGESKEAVSLISSLMTKIFKKAGVCHGWYLLLCEPNISELYSLISHSELPKLTDSAEENARMMEAFDTAMVKKVASGLSNRKKREAMAETMVTALFQRVDTWLDEMAAAHEKLAADLTATLEEFSKTMEKLAALHSEAFAATA